MSITVQARGKINFRMADRFALAGARLPDDYIPGQLINIFAAAFELLKTGLELPAHLVQVRTLLLFVRALSLFHCAPAFAFQSLDLLLHKQHMLPLPLQAAL